MTTKITSQILESAISCRSKAHLKLNGQQGQLSDYARLLAALREQVRLKAVDRILARHPPSEVERNVSLTQETLRKGVAYVLDISIEDASLSLVIDGLRKVAGTSKLGDFHYIPVLFSEGRKIEKEQRLLLGLYGLLLSRVQDRVPTTGIIFHGPDCTVSRVRLPSDPRKGEQFLRDVIAMVTPSEPAPKLVLNDHCHVCEFRQQCHQQAVQTDNITLLRGVSDKEAKRLARKGILTLAQLAHTFRPRRKGKRQGPNLTRHSHALKALAVRDKKVYAHGTPELRDAPVRIYLDIEGDPDADYVYLIGLIVVRADSETRFSFWADSREQEMQIFEEFLAEIARHDDFLIFSYGSYERTFIARMRKTASRKGPVDKVLDALVNTLSVIYSHVYFPCYSNSLKEVAGCLGFTWTESNASGAQSIVWRKEWEATGTEMMKQTLATYNLEDCAALRRVTEFVYSIYAKTPLQTAPATGVAAGPPVTAVQDIARWDNNRNFGNVNFVYPDFQRVNACAYFDYQRARVYIRSSEKLKKRLRPRKRNQRCKLRVSKLVRITSRWCPSCGGEVTTGGKMNEVTCPFPRRKKAFDLKFADSGIKRVVIECRTLLYRCLACGHNYIPDRHQRLDKHFHGLKSWVAYQHVAHNLSLGAISLMLEEFFRLRVSVTELHMFKALLTRYYRPVARDSLKRLLAGNLLHIDETEVQLKTGKGYVWVLTNLEDVVFLYRPTREGEFLKALLKNFRGVLVSDFYAAYDSLTCPQQKCLIHLMRDMNQELLNAPFDEELQAITRPFGVLLRAIIETVDTHGLRAKHLRGHSRDAERYFESLSSQTFHSENAESLRVRLLKCRDKLFTFLQHDGVPWNNNNAEHAIKQFAYYREGREGMLLEGGLRDYLALLSLRLTCKYRGVSFLKFLTSRTKDLEAFAENRHARQKLPFLQLYPKGFVPPHHASRGKSAKVLPQDGTPSASE